MDKIYIFIALMRVGGAERVCVTLANELIKKGKEVHLIVLNLEGDVNTHLLDKRCHVHVLNVSRIRYAAFPMLKFIRKEKPKSILVFGDNMAYLLNNMRKLRLIDTNIVLRLLNNVDVTYKKEDHVSKNVEKYLKNQQKNLKDMDAVICQCNAMKEMIVDRNLVNQEKLHVIYNPVNPSVIENTLEERKMQIISDKKEIIFLGRLDPQKNPEHLLKAFSILCALRNDVRLRIVGDGVLRKQMEELACQLNIQDEISFEGVRQDVHKVYGKADLAVLSSDYEGMPNFLIESICSGIPVVAYNCPIGPEEIVIDGINGYLVQLHNINELAEKMNKALDESFHTKKIMETGDKFQASKAAEKISDLINSVENRTQKKLAFYIGDLGKGGAERVICNLAEYFYEIHYPTIMVTKQKENDEYELNPQINRILADITKEEETNNRFTNLIKRIKKLRAIWKSEKPDVIVAFLGKNNFMAIVSSLFLSTKVIVSVRSAPEREYGTKQKKILAKILFGFADGVVLQTSDAFKFFPKRIQKKAALLPNSLSPEFLKPCFEGVRDKEIVTVGRIDTNKNQIMLVRAFAQIAEQFPEWKCVLYGDGEGRSQIENYVKQNDLEHRIILKGRTSNIQDIIYKSEIFVLPSKVEGMPNALIEAMVLGLAVISTDCPCGGPKDLIQDGENGLLISVDNEKELKEALYRLIREEETRKKLGKNARKIIDKVHPEVINKQWESYITTR